MEDIIKLLNSKEIKVILLKIFKSISTGYAAGARVKNEKGRRFNEGKS